MIALMLCLTHPMIGKPMVLDKPAWPHKIVALQETGLSGFPARFPVVSKRAVPGG